MIHDIWYMRPSMDEDHVEADAYSEFVGLDANRTRTFMSPLAHQPSYISLDHSFGTQVSPEKKEEPWRTISIIAETQCNKFSYC